MRRHKPVMLQETIDWLPQQCTLVMDGTFGHGGHTAGMLAARHDIRVVGVDRDEAMIAKAKQFLQEEHLLDRVDIVQTSYADFETISKESGVKQFDALLIDIGVNMDHFKEADRGFSIKLDGALDMRYDREVWEPASVVLERISYDEFCEMLEQFTDFWQKYREQIAAWFISVRKKQPFHTTQEIREWAKTLWINDKKLAVVFQAIRIKVNGELDELQKFLQSFPDFLISGGRCLVMTYHSWEDRMVKYAFKDLVDQWIWVLINKKVITPVRTEVKKNKAARSAKLRIFEKI